MNPTYELVVGNRGAYRRRDFWDREAATAAFEEAQRGLASGMLTSVSLSAYDLQGVPRVIRHETSQPNREWIRGYVGGRSPTTGYSDEP